MALPVNSLNHIIKPYIEKEVPHVRLCQGSDG